mmetsp:Transcript_7060/g.18434  ORF Transcript_7060/g.18434 Transcript_7060/m.18434 type:complete len:164 (+) Transcript_7060:30-521(+)
MAAANIAAILKSMLPEGAATPLRNGSGCHECNAPCTGAPQVCARCQRAQYCGRACQRENWANHKFDCQTRDSRVQAKRDSFDGGHEPSDASIQMALDVTREHTHAARLILMILSSGGMLVLGSQEDFCGALKLRACLIDTRTLFPAAAHLAGPRISSPESPVI